MPFAERLQKLRESRMMKPESIAAILEINLHTYRGYEAGERNPKPQTLVKLAMFLNVSVDYLLGHTDDPAPVKGLDSAIYNLPWSLERLRKARNVDPKDIAAVLEITPWAYYNYEQGRRELKADALIALADHYGVSIDEVLGRGLEMPAVPPSIEPALSSAEPIRPFPEILNECMNRRKATAERMAKYLGITSSAYRRYLSGKKLPDLWLLVRLADFFGVSADYLLGRTADPAFTRRFEREEE